MSNRKVAVYGSLRVGEYNFNRFLNYYPNEIKFIGRYVVKGFDLMNLGSYPGVRVSENNEQELTIDILECDEECFRQINSMEIGAGYEANTIVIDNHECIIYIYRHKVSDSRKVLSGDWTKYLKERDKEEYVY